MKFEIYQDNKDEWRWSFIANNGETLAVSSEGYTRRESLADALALLRMNVINAPVVIRARAVRATKVTSERLTDESVESSAVQVLETFQRAVASSVKERGFDGKEPRLLNVLNTGLFGLLCQCRLFVPRKAQGEKS